MNKVRDEVGLVFLTSNKIEAKLMNIALKQDQNYQGPLKISNSLLIILPLKVLCFYKYVIKPLSSFMHDTGNQLVNNFLKSQLHWEIIMKNTQFKDSTLA